MVRANPAPHGLSASYGSVSPAPLWPRLWPNRVPRTSGPPPADRPAQDVVAVEDGPRPMAGDGHGHPPSQRALDDGHVSRGAIAQKPRKPWRSRRCVLLSRLSPQPTSMQVRANGPPRAENSATVPSSSFWQRLCSLRARGYPALCARSPPSSPRPRQPPAIAGASVPDRSDQVTEQYLCRTSDGERHSSKSCIAPRWEFWQSDAILGPGPFPGISVAPDVLHSHWQRP